MGIGESRVDDQPGEDVEARDLVARMRNDPEGVLAWRLAERDDELDARIGLIRAAADNDPPEPAPGRFDEFVELMGRVDADEILELVTRLHRYGYVVVPDVLSPEQVERTRDGLAPLFERAGEVFERVVRPSHRNGPGGGQTVHIQNVISKSRAADDALTTPRLRAVAAGVLCHDFVLNVGAVAMSPDPGCSPQGLHRDDGFFTLIPRPHLPLIITAAIALDDFTPENGSTAFVPGSQRWLDGRAPDPEDIVRARMPAGAALVWDGAVLHGGGANESDRSRRTLTVNYARGWVRTQFNQYLSVPRETVLALPAELQADLGYAPTATRLGTCDTQHPLAYLRRLTDAGGDGHQPELGTEADIEGLIERSGRQGR